MVKTRIQSVALINKNAAGEVINLTVIKTTCGKTAIVRKPKEMLQDLKNSYLIGNNVQNIEHPAVRMAFKGLKGGIVEGNIEYSKKGDKWEVTEDSLCMKVGHPDFGTASVGDERTLERDQARVVDGFLELEQNMQYQALQMNALAIADATAGIADIYAPVVAEPTTTINSSGGTYEVNDATQAAAEAEYAAQN